jgi:hypothetical protein
VVKATLLNDYQVGRGGGKSDCLADFFQSNSD